MSVACARCIVLLTLLDEDLVQLADRLLLIYGDAIDVVLLLPTDTLANELDIVPLFRANLEVLPESSQHSMLKVGVADTKEVIYAQFDDSGDILSVGWT